MRTVTSAQFIDQLDRLAKTTERHNRSILTTALRAGQDIVRTEMVAHGVTPKKQLHGIRGVARLDPKYKIHGDTHSSATLYMNRPAWLVNNPTQPHVIGAKLLGTRSAIARRAGGGRGAFGAFRTSYYRRGVKYDRKGAKALTVGPDFYAYVKHPGTPGKPFWQAAVPKVNRSTREIVPRAYRTVWIEELNR